MKQLIAVAWKEWREIRWVVGTALVVFIALPAIAGIEGRPYAHRFAFEASPWVMFLGGLLATIAGATSVARDSEGRTFEFWRSRPVATWRWIAIKYGVGLLVVIASCIVPLVIEEWHEGSDPQGSQHFAAVVAAWFPFIGAVQYSLGFFSGGIMRRGGRAVMLALSLSLLAYFLPLLLPPLRSLNVPEVFMYSSSDEFAQKMGGHGHVPWVPWHVPFVAEKQMPLVVAAIVLSGAALMLTIIAIARGWQIRAAQKLTYWSIAGVILLALGSAAFQLGTNLTVLQTVDVGPDDEITFIHTEAGRGAIGYIKLDTKRHFSGDAFRSIKVVADRVQLGPEIVLPRQWFLDRRQVAWLPDHPDHCFGLTWHSSPGQIKFSVVNLRNPCDPLLATVDLGRLDTFRGQPLVQVVGNRLYAMWWKDEFNRAAAIIDVTYPAQPKVLPSTPVSINDRFFGELLPAVFSDLLPVEDVTMQQRLKASVALTMSVPAAMEGDVLTVSSWNNPLTTYRVGAIVANPPTATAPSQGTAGKTTVEFRPIGRYQPSLLEDVINAYTTQIVSGPHGLVYLSEQTSTFGTPLSRVSVFDVSDPAFPRPVGHFGLPRDEQLAISPLPDGKVLVGGRKLYLLGAPARRK